MKTKQRRKVSNRLWPLLLFFALIGGTACEKEDVNWKEDIEGSTFHDFETVLYKDEIPEAVDKDNAVYLFYTDSNGSDDPMDIDYKKSESYFHYSIGFIALYSDGKKYRLNDEEKIVKKFIAENKISTNGIKIQLSGIIVDCKGAAFIDNCFSFKATNIKIKEKIQ